MRPSPARCCSPPPAAHHLQFSTFQPLTCTSHRIPGVLLVFSHQAADVWPSWATSHLLGRRGHPSSDPVSPTFSPESLLLPSRPSNGYRGIADVVSDELHTEIRTVNLLYVCAGLVVHLASVERSRVRARLQAPVPPLGNCGSNRTSRTDRLKQRSCVRRVDGQHLSPSGVSSQTSPS